MGRTPDTELAWAAGLFDGEGWVGTDNTKRQRGRMRLNLVQIDRYVLDRFQRAVKVGAVYGPYGPYQRSTDPDRPRKPEYVFCLQSREDIRKVWYLLAEYLSPIKRAQFENAILKYEESKNAT